MAMNETSKCSYKHIVDQFFSSFSTRTPSCVKLKCSPRTQPKQSRKNFLNTNNVWILLVLQNSLDIKCKKVLKFFYDVAFQFWEGEGCLNILKFWHKSFKKITHNPNQLRASFTQPNCVLMRIQFPHYCILYHDTHDNLIHIASVQFNRFFNIFFLFLTVQ